MNNKPLNEITNRQLAIKLLCHFNGSEAFRRIQNEEGSLSDDLLKELDRRFCDGRVYRDATEAPSELFTNVTDFIKRTDIVRELHK